MNIVINPQYRFLESFVKSVPDSFEEEGDIFYNERNLLKTFSVQGYDIIVKRFRIPILINRIAYSYFRPSKAKRSFEHAFILKEKGINTPDPIAYIEDKKMGLIKYSYYICLFEKDSTHIRKQMSGTEAGDQFLKSLASFIANLHNKGILFLDLSPGNIMFLPTADQPVFFLVDINRMKFLSKIPEKVRYENFERISEKPNIITSLAREYARICSFDEQQAINDITRNCNDFFYKKYKRKIVVEQ